MFEHHALKWFHIIAIAVVLVGALNWLSIGLWRFDFVVRALGKRAASWVFIFVGVCALSLLFHRDTYLPFLGEAAVPCAVLSDRTPPGAAREVRLQVAPGAKVVFWAAEPDTEHLERLNDWRKAYLKFENAGVATADTEGNVVLRVREPQAYTVMGGRRIGPHIHYRVCSQEHAGMLGRVQTVFLD